MNWNVMRLRGVATLLVAFSVGILGCASSSEEVPVRPIIRDTNLIDANHNAADALLARAPWLKERRDPLLAATFVDINNLDASSALGRVIGEQIGSQFAQQGFTVIELKMRNNIFMVINAAVKVFAVYRLGGVDRRVNDVALRLRQLGVSIAVIKALHADGRNAAVRNIALAHMLRIQVKARIAVQAGCN